MKQRTTAGGSTITLHAPNAHGDAIFTADHPEAPAEMRNVELGRLSEAPGRGTGFQSAPYTMALLSPDALRAIAELIEEAGQ